jgi:hypothetical protein
MIVKLVITQRNRAGFRGRRVCHKARSFSNNILGIMFSLVISRCVKAGKCSNAEVHRTSHKSSPSAVSAIYLCFRISSRKSSLCTH